MIAQRNQDIAVPDTYVLVPLPLCDPLLRLAEDPVFCIPKWASDILRELRSTLQRVGYTSPQADRRVTATHTQLPGAPAHLPPLTDWTGVFTPDSGARALG